MNEELVKVIKSLMETSIRSNKLDVQEFNKMKVSGASKEELIAKRDSMMVAVNQYNDCKKDLNTYLKAVETANSINQKENPIEYKNAMDKVMEIEKSLTNKYSKYISNKDNSNAIDAPYDITPTDNNRKKVNPVVWVCVAGAIILAAIGTKSCSKQESKPVVNQEVTEDEYIRTTNTPVVNTPSQNEKKEYTTNSVFPDTKEGKEAKALYEKIMLEKCPNASDNEFNRISDSYQLDARCEEIYDNLQELDTNDKQVKNISKSDIKRIMNYIHNGKVDDIKVADKDAVMLDILSIYDAEIYDAVRVANGNIKASDARKPYLNSMLFAKDGSELQENLYKLQLLRQYLVKNPSKENANIYSLALMALAIDTWYVGDPTNSYTIDSFDTAGEKFLYETAILESLAVAGRNPKETKMQFIKMHDGKEEMCEISLEDLTKSLNCNDYVIDGDLAEINDTKKGKKVTETKYWGYKMLEEAVLNEQYGLVRK